MTDYLSAREAIEELKIPASTFYRFVKEGKIQKYFPTAVSKHGLYDSKEIARLSSKLRHESGQKDQGETDWIQSSDMGNMYDLEYKVYGDETGNPSIVRKWYERNPNICRVLYNKEERRDFWGAINMLPLREETIFKLLRGEMRDVDLDPQKDILTFDEPGTYDFYVASVIIRPQRRQYFIHLVNSIFDFWCEQAPERIIGKIYGRILSEAGELMVKKLFFSPIWHVAENAYVLDMSRPNPSRIVQGFQYCITSKSGEMAMSTAHVTNADHTLHERLDQAESIIDVAWESWFASQPQQAAREVTKLLPGLEKLAYDSSIPAMSLRAKEQVIRCHGLLGAICIDTLQNDTALYHYVQAHRFAEEIHDINLVVTYLAMMGEVRRRQNDKLTAVSYMEQARSRFTRVNRATMGHILQLLAYTYADVGNEIAFERTIAEAIGLLAFTGEGRDATQKEFIPFQVYEIQGKANRDLGRPLKAIPYLELAEKSLGKAETVTPRWHALLDISRGQAYCDAGDIATGVELASKGFTLAYQCQSPRQMNRVRKLLKKLEEGQWRGERKIMELRELVHEAYLNIDLDK